MQDILRINLQGSAFPALVVSDLHLTDNPRDEYRWGLFDWIWKQHQQLQFASLFVLGDITDAKDQHSAVLVNRVASSFRQLREALEINVVLLMGNHDYLIKGHPFFHFLGDEPGLFYISRPMADPAAGILFLPHTKTPTADWATLDFNAFKLVLMHQTVQGAVASNGMRMSGELPADMRATARILSGDIHVPQKVGNVEYVGSPYHVHFGDRFNARCMLLESPTQSKDLKFPTIEKFVATIESVEALDSLKLRPNDQLKLRIKVKPSELTSWQTLRTTAFEWCKAAGVDLRSVELVPNSVRRIRLLDSEEKLRGSATAAEDVLLRFCDREKLSAMHRDLGLEILKAAE